jgi:hypothetical protein
MGMIFDSGACRVEWMDAEQFRQVWRFAKGANDRGLSFTDCFSFWLMERLDLTEVLTRDRHFEYAEFTVLASD